MNDIKDRACALQRSLYDMDNNVIRIPENVQSHCDITLQVIFPCLLNALNLKCPVKRDPLKVSFTKAYSVTINATLARGFPQNRCCYRLKRKALSVTGGLASTSYQRGHIYNTFGKLE